MALLQSMYINKDTSSAGNRHCSVLTDLNCGVYKRVMPQVETYCELAQLETEQSGLNTSYASIRPEHTAWKIVTHFPLVTSKYQLCLAGSALSHHSKLLHPGTCELRRCTKPLVPALNYTAQTMMIMSVALANYTVKL